MKFTLYPHSIATSTAEYSGNPEFQGGFFGRFKELVLYLKAQDKGNVAAAAVAIVQFAEQIGCEVEFIGNPDAGYQEVRVTSRIVRTEREGAIWQSWRNARPASPSRR